MTSFNEGKRYNGDSITSHKVKPCTLYVEKMKGACVEGTMVLWHEDREEERFKVSLEVYVFESGLEFVMFEHDGEEYMVCVDGEDL